VQKSPKKRLIFCTYSSIYSSIVLKKLLNDRSLEVVAIINSNRVINPNYGFIKGALTQIKLSGWRYASYLFMVTDLFSWLNPSQTVHGLAKKNTIPVFDTNDINSSESLDFIDSKQPDVLLAAHFNQLIKTPLLNRTCLNIHPSLLPAYKGVDPVFYALLDQQKSLGVTLHKMAESFDTGEVLLQKEFQVPSDASVFSGNCFLFEAGVDLAIHYLVAEEKTEQSKKNISTADNMDYDSWPSRASISKLKQQGKVLVCLKQYWQELHNV
jgi:methionyl-tRNA formyltransferase